ncbi:MAG: hypothetical protein U1C51_00285 [Candidatus Izemoplasmatales bacterium]|nr:hypothetical protein [bacterium]MDZ4195665.1 hypothetical protein [Candidatus Izemoplasmatales bacterium]
MKTLFQLGPIFTSNMVFQWNQPIRIFGTCKKGIEIKLEFIDHCIKQRTTSSTFLFEIKPFPSIKEPFEIVITCKNQEVVLDNCLVGDVFILCGADQVAMTVEESYEDLPSPNSMIRYFDIPKMPYLDAHIQSPSLYPNNASWNVCKKDTLRMMSALGYHISKELEYDLDIPVGIITASFEDSMLSSWTGMLDLCSLDRLGKILSYYKQEVSSYELSTDYDQAYAIQAAKQHAFLDAVKKEQRQGISRYIAKQNILPQISYYLPMGPKHFNRPSGLFEHMIKPYGDIGVKAVVLYAGEYDLGVVDFVEDITKMLIQSWRKNFRQPKLPFVVVQMTGHHYQGINHDVIPRMREAQRRCIDLANHVYFASAVDLGEESSPIPREKSAISKRIAKVILEKVYKLEKSSMSPAYYSHQVTNDTLAIYTEYNHLHLVSRSRNFMGFYGKYQDGTIKPLRKVKTQANQIIIEGIKQLQEIMYCWENFPVCDLYTTNDLPLLPFKISIE